MLKTFLNIVLAFFLTVSILGPSFVNLLENHMDIEIVQDIEEDATKEAKLDLEEKQKILNRFSLASRAITAEVVRNMHYYLHKTYDFAIEVQSPPPEQNC